MSTHINSESLALPSELRAAAALKADADRLRYELQARIVAGSIVIAGVGLGLFVSPYWFGLSAFVGCGLIFAGITGKCPMASLLAAFPCNQSCCSTNRRGA